MKKILTLAIGAAALVSTTLVQAQVTINIVASNGDRNPSQSAIGHILSGTGSQVRYQGVLGSVTGTWTGTTAVPNIARQSNFGTWEGTFSGTTVRIQTNYSGALTGIAAVAGNVQQRFINPALLTWTGTVPDPLVSTDPSEYVVQTADLGLSTNFQDTSPFTPGVYNNITFSEISQVRVGVSPIVFVASPGFPANNITTQQAYALYQTGYLSLAVFTGSASDENKFVYAVGRNQDAGQRYASYLEVGFGVNDAVNVFLPTISGQQTSTSGATSGFNYGGTVDNHELWPLITTPSGLTSNTVGNGGFNTANDLAPVLTVTGFSATAAQYASGDAVGAYYIGYVTRNDYDSRILPFNGVLLKYNGVDQSPANIRNGTYTHWVYNRLLRRLGTVASPGYTAFTGYTGGGTASPALKAAFYNQLLTQILTQDATNGGGIKLDSTFRVERQRDGGLVSPTYY